MQNSWYKYIAAGSIVAGWFGKASMDGKITTGEIVGLIDQLSELFDLTITFSHTESASSDKSSLTASYDVYEKRPNDL